MHIRMSYDIVQNRSEIMSEKVITAKILMLLDPDRFIAWDNQNSA